MTRSTKRVSRGFTLIEVLIAVAIMAITLVAILKSNMQSQDVFITSGQMTTASLIAQEVMARIEATGPDNWSEFSGESEEHPGFTWQVETANTPSPGLSRVIVIVTWEGNTYRPARFERLFYGSRQDLL